ncbi:hypothetical protein [Streptomyces glaucosporus]
MSLPVLPIVLISGVQLQIELQPAALYAALATAVGAAGGYHFTRRRHR